MCDKTPANLAALSDGGGQRAPAHGVSQLAAQKVSAATIVLRVGSSHGFRNIRLRPMVRPVRSDSRPAPDAYTPGGLGMVSVAPTVTSGGQTIYFDTINTAQVGLNPDDGSSPRQPRIAVTNIESLEWETVAWSREVWIEDYGTSTGMARSRMDIPVRHLPHDGQECPSYTHPEILQPLEHTTVQVEVELAEPVPDEMVGTLHLAWYDPDNTLGNEPSTPPSHNGHGRRDNAQGVELVRPAPRFPAFRFPERLVIFVLVGRMKVAELPVSTRRYAIMIKATVKGGRLEVEVPADWPDGTEVEVCPLATGIQDDAGMMSDEEIARTIAAMDQVEPMEITATEQAAWEAERAGRLRSEKAQFAEHAESLRRIWE